MSWKVPSYIIPYVDIITDSVSVVKGDAVILTDDWGRPHPSGSVLVDKIEYHYFVNSWSYFHALLSNSRLPLYAVQSRGLPNESFSLKDIDRSSDATVPREIYFDPADMIPAIFLGTYDGPIVSYEKLYETFRAKNETYLSAVKTYFLAQDINFNKRLRSIDTSYWQVVMFVSGLESLLPPPQYCNGDCSRCTKDGKGKHLLNDVNGDWNRFLFHKIKNKKVRTNYRLILDVARWQIRNDTVHNGLMPDVRHSTASTSDGVTVFTTKKAIENYLSDSYSLESLIEQLRQICRIALLNEIFTEPFYPDLEGIEIHTKTIKNITTNNFTFNLDF